MSKSTLYASTISRLPNDITYRKRITSYFKNLISTSVNNMETVQTVSNRWDLLNNVSALNTLIRYGFLSCVK